MINCSRKGDIFDRPVQSKVLFEDIMCGKFLLRFFDLKTFTLSTLALSCPNRECAGITELISNFLRFQLLRAGCLDKFLSSITRNCNCWEVWPTQTAFPCVLCYFQAGDMAGPEVLRLGSHKLRWCALLKSSKQSEKAVHCSSHFPAFNFSD